MRILTEAPSFIAEALGVPVVMANKVGPWRTPMPGIFPDEDTVFAGGSTIVDADAPRRTALATTRASRWRRSPSIGSARGRRYLRSAGAGRGRCPGSRASGKSPK
jgi:hypothetical protein